MIRISASEERLYIRISDDGRGMTDEKLKELNEKLRRLDVETDVPEKEEEKKSGQDIPNQRTKGISLSVKTGDSTPTEVNLYLALLSLAAVILLLKEKRRKNR